jgi:hypothetical protein
MVGRVADRAVQIFGGAGYVADYGIERFYRDVRIARIYEGTSQIQQIVMARETMKRGRLKKQFFFEKKNQKTFVNLLPTPAMWLWRVGADFVDDGGKILGASGLSEGLVKLRCQPSHRGVGTELRRAILREFEVF